MRHTSLAPGNHTGIELTLAPVNPKNEAHVSRPRKEPILGRGRHTSLTRGNRTLAPVEPEKRTRAPGTRTAFGTCEPGSHTSLAHGNHTGAVRTLAPVDPEEGAHAPRSRTGTQPDSRPCEPRRGGCLAPENHTGPPTLAPVSPERGECNGDIRVPDVVLVYVLAVVLSQSHAET